MADKKILVTVGVVLLIIAVAAVAVIVSGINKPVTDPGANGGDAVARAISSANSTHAPVTIKISGYWGVDGLTTYDPALLAEHLGYYGSDIHIEDSNVDVGAPGIAAISAGHIQAAHVPYLTLIRAVAAGSKVTAVVDAHGANSTTNWHIFTLDNSGITSAKDLKGKRIGGVIPGDTSYIAMEAYLKTAGLTINDVTLVSVPFGQEDVALKAHTVDVSGVWPDYEIINMQDGGGVRLLYTMTDSLPPGLEHCGIVFSNDYISQNPGIIKEFVAGVVKANEWAQQNPDKAKQFYKDLALQRGKDTSLVDKYFVNTDIRPKSLIRENPDITYYYDYLIGSGEIKPGQVNIQDIYTNVYNPYNT